MATSNQLIQIAEYLGLDSIKSELKTIKKRSQEDNAQLIIPLVGEFSSGKTTLINSLTDSKVLETATRPTTATIYEIHFGCDTCSAKIMNADGTQHDAGDLHNLKNEELKDASVVSLFDTSTKVPSTTVLVDTPGLSSPDPMHKQALVNFLPSADGVLLVIDINAQFTRSLESFVNDSIIVKRPIYVVVTQCDTKPVSVREETKSVIMDKIGSNVRDIAFVSAKDGDIVELYKIFERIQCEKNTILQQVNEQRLALVAKRLEKHINDLLESTKQNDDIDDAIREQENQLKKLQQNIRHLIDDTNISLQDEEREVVRNFDDIVSDKLDTLVVSKCADFDAAAVSTINSTVSLLTSDYCDRIKHVLSLKANERLKSAESVPLGALETIDLSNTTISGISYDLDLNSLGHEHDKAFATATKVVAAAGAVVAVTAGAAAGAAGAAAKGVAGMTTAEGVSTFASVADTATDVATMASNVKTVKRIKAAVNFAGQAGEHYNNIQNYNNVIGNQMGCKKGIVESMVGFVTDKAWGKPQRKRAIRNYVDGTLMPQFKREISRIHRDIISTVETCLMQEANGIFNEKSSALEQLKQEKQKSKELYVQKISKLKELRQML